MLKLNTLSFSGIGRFVEKQTVDFRTLGHLVQVDALNRNTGGSSGSGKSTVFNALDYLLGLNDLAATVLQSRLTKDSISVEANFDWDGKDLTVTRGKKGLVIEIDGKVHEGASKLQEEKLLAIMGMPPKVFRKILHKRQKEGGFFLEFTPKAMYEFLTDALNMSGELKKLETVEKKISELKDAKTARQNEIDRLQSALRATQESVLSLGLPPIRDIHQSVIIDLKGKYDGSAQKYKEVEEKHKQESDGLQATRPQITTQAYDRSNHSSLTERKNRLADEHSNRRGKELKRISDVRANIASATLEQSKLNYSVSEGNTCKIHATDLAGQVKKIRDAICPTCEQNWITEAAKAKEGELLTKLAGHKEKIAEGVKAAARLAELATVLATLQEELKPRDDEGLLPIMAEIHDIDLAIKEEAAKETRFMQFQNGANAQLLESFDREQTALRHKHTLERSQAAGQLDIDRRAFEAAVAKLKAYDEAAKRYETTLLSMKANESIYLGQLASAKMMFEKIESDLLMAEELKRVVKAFISCSFDDALETISEESTKIIRCVPTMANATIQFEGQKETQDGKVKEEVNAVISMDGDIGIPIKSLSGGERSSVDLAVDLAVIDFIETTSAKGIDVFILDEPFTGLDTVGIEMVLEFLKNLTSTKKLIVVDHNPEVKQMVSNRLVVVRDGNTSTISSEEA